MTIHLNKCKNTCYICQHSITRYSSLYLKIKSCLFLLILMEKYCHMVSISVWFLLQLFSSENIMTKQNLQLRWQTHFRYVWKLPLREREPTTKMTNKDHHHVWEIHPLCHSVFHLVLVSVFTLMQIFLLVLASKRLSWLQVMSHLAILYNARHFRSTFWLYFFWFCFIFVYLFVYYSLLTAAVSVCNVNVSLDFLFPWQNQI